MNVRSLQYYSTPEAAKLLGISRVEVFRRIKKGEIKAQKIGRNFAIPKIVLDELCGQNLSSSDKQRLNQAVHRTVKEYGETLRLLGRE